MKNAISPPERQREIKKIAVAVFALAAAAFVFFVSEAAAHSKLLRSKPADAEILRERPEAIELTFKERIQATSANTVIVTDSGGRRVDKNQTIVSEDGRRLLAELENLAAGAYSVEWRTLSADNHSIRGKFSFTVAESDSAPVLATLDSPNAGETIHEHEPPQENQFEVLQSFARWLMYLAAMTLFGGFAFLLLVLKPVFARDISGADENERIFGFEQGKNRFVRLAWASLFLLVGSALAGLLLQARAVTDGGIFQLLAETSYGAPFLLHLLAALALFGVVFSFARSDSGAATKLSRAGLVASSLLFLMPSLTGHARAAGAEFAFAEFSDWLHQAAAGVWVGGLFHLALTFPKSVERFGAEQRLTAYGGAVSFFTRLAIACAVLLALTGIYGSLAHLESFSDLRDTSYGTLLLVKIALFLVMLALGGLNGFIMRSAARKLSAETIFAGKTSKIYRNFYRALVFEAVIGVAVLLLAAILAFLPSARSHETMHSDRTFLCTSARASASG